MASVIKMPEQLARELDRLAGAEKKPRTTYVTDLLWRDVRRHQQRAALNRSAGALEPSRPSGISRRRRGLRRPDPRRDRRTL